MDEDKCLRSALSRIVSSKIGVDVRYAEQLATYGGPVRDRGGWTVSVAFIAMVGADAIPERLLPDLFSVEEARGLRLGFDHSEIVSAGIERLQDKSTYSSLPAFLLPEFFTLHELRQVYGLVTGALPRKSWFREQVLRQELVEPTWQLSQGGRHRPAELYRVREIKALAGRLKVS